MNKLEKTVGSMLEPAWLYADLGEEKNPLKVLAETVEKYNCRGAVVHLGDLTTIWGLGCEKIIPVVDFPYGRGSTTGKRMEARWAAVAGVISVDVVINLWALQNKDWGIIKDELKAVKEECGNDWDKKEIKVICQMPFIWQYHRNLIPLLLDELVEGGVNAIKDWTTINNFSKPIKTDTETRVEYIKYLRDLIDKYKFPLKIKVAGGVNEENVVAFKKAGADIFGISCQKTPAVLKTLVEYLKKIKPPLS